jgi:hypothetical protein
MSRSAAALRPSSKPWKPKDLGATTSALKTIIDDFDNVCVECRGECADGFKVLSNLALASALSIQHIDAGHQSASKTTNSVLLRVYEKRDTTTGFIELCRWKRQKKQMFGLKHDEEGRKTILATARWLHDELVKRGGVDV